MRLTRGRIEATRLSTLDEFKEHKSSFLNCRDPSRLKHKVVEIEGVVDIDSRAVFLAKKGSP